MIFAAQYKHATPEKLAEPIARDYRMPQDIGLSDVNHSWAVPDLSEVCRKRFGLKH